MQHFSFRVSGVSRALLKLRSPSVSAHIPITLRLGAGERTALRISTGYFSSWRNRSTTNPVRRSLPKINTVQLSNLRCPCR